MWRNHLSDENLNQMDGILMTIMTKVSRLPMYRMKDCAAHLHRIRLPGDGHLILDH